jgi:TetR/AcrR family transcriptional regulator
MARPATDIKERVLAAAADQFAGVGVDGASLRQIASAAGTSVAMIGYHFESKDGLFRAVVDDVYDRFLSDLEAIAAQHEQPLLRVQALMGRMSHVTPEELRMLRALVREETVESERLQYVIGRFMMGHGRLLMTALSEAMDAGLIRRAPLPTMLPLMIAPIVFPQMLAGAVGMALPGLAEAGSTLAFDLVFNGLRPRDDVHGALGTWSGFGESGAKAQTQE